jgi:hypothetical protein
MGRNRRTSKTPSAAGRGRLSIDAAVPASSTCSASQASGGLLFAVDPDASRAVHEGFARQSRPVWEIGEVIAEPRLALA